MKMLLSLLAIWAVTPPCAAQELMAKVGSGIRQPLPAPEVMLIMMRSSLLAVGQANYTGNYSVLRALATKSFGEKNDEAALTAAFKAVRSVPLDYWSVAILAPQLTEPPQVSDAGLLRLACFVPTRPVELTFQLVYAPEGGGWRLDGIGLGARQTAVQHPLGAGNQPPTSAATLSTLPAVDTSHRPPVPSKRSLGVVSPAAAAAIQTKR